MYKIEYTPKAQNVIKNFIESYKNTFLERFSDTGIYSESIIRNNYINRSISFYEEIIDWIESNLSEENIFWYSPITLKKALIKIKVFNYKLNIFYIETKSKKIREVYNIEFHN